jgi:ribonuclease HI
MAQRTREGSEALRVNHDRHRHETKKDPHMTTTTTTMINLEKFNRLRRAFENIGAATRDRSAQQAELRELIRQLETAQRRGPVRRDIYTDVGHSMTEGGTAVREQRRVDGGISAQDAEKLATYQREFEAGRADLQALSEQREEIGGLVTRLAEFIRGQGFDPDRLPVMAPPRLDLSGPRPTLADVQTIRERITDRQQARKAVTRALVSQRESHARIASWLEQAQSRGALSVGAFIRPGSNPKSFRLLPTDTNSPAELASAIEALLATLAGDALADALGASVEDEAAAAGGWGLPAAERAERLAAIDAELFGLELDEEHAIERLEAEGVVILRRRDADPRAVLQLTPVADLAG